VQPGPERTSVVETSKRGECALEAVRGHVVGQRAAAGDRVRGAPGVAPVAAEEDGSGVTVAASRPSYEISVTWLTHSSAVWYERAAFTRPATGILTV
jgi:hypothetical protein